MYRRYATLLLGSAAVALAVGPIAAADPVSDAWPFGDNFQLPGYSVGAHLTGSPFLTGTEPWSDPGGDYSTHFSGVEMAFVGYNIHRSVFDSDNPLVPNGTTWDGVSLPGFSNTMIFAPGIGIGDQISFGTLSNSFIVDTAGIQDVLTLGSYPPVTLFDVPMDLSGLFGD
ncbi:hypothetical protein KIH27_05795 [Mycobacterium sp. M1]|uniref:Uncharacterized protein n=1 Tax=Mycolicibacter acidiphilus TaxID=2835306 RepID=A0ABS5RFP6_9MYCO|nr:hypothetical protein [Mycolicibacter acidiphilus]MBS9533101.1 hypothetical protein [Mycolicibacter acidiphilus]